MSTDKTKPGSEKAEAAVRSLLDWMGENPDRPGLAATPERVARSMARLTDRDGTDLEDLLAKGIFPAEGSGLVLIRDVEFYSLCEHHLLPFFGRCHVAYLPAESILGFSRIPRLVNHFARRLQVQERLTRQIAETLEEAIQPLLHVLPDAVTPGANDHTSPDRGVVGQLRFQDHFVVPGAEIFPPWGQPFVVSHAVPSVLISKLCRGTGPVSGTHEDTPIPREG